MLNFIKGLRKDDERKSRLHILPPRRTVYVIKDYLRICACKKADERDSIIIRLFNSSCEEIDADVKLSSVLKELYSTNLLEKRHYKLDLSDNTLKLTVGAKKIITLELVY